MALKVMVALLKQVSGTLFLGPKPTIWVKFQNIIDILSCQLLRENFFTFLLGKAFRHASIYVCIMRRRQTTVFFPLMQSKLDRLPADV